MTIENNEKKESNIFCLLALVLTGSDGVITVSAEKAEYFTNMEETDCLSKFQVAKTRNDDGSITVKLVESDNYATDRAHSE